jgi:carbon storage regulator
MLVLTRKRNQSIVIGSDIEVAVIDIRGDQVRLGVAAPAKVPVHRRELYNEVEQANRAAASKPERLAEVEAAIRQASLAGLFRRIGPSR